MTVAELPVRYNAAPQSTFSLAGMSPWDLAQHIAQTEFVPSGLRGRPEAVLACFLYGHEIGVGPMESLSNIAVIDGRPAVSAQLMRARVLGAGHELWEEDATTTRVTMSGRRAGSTRIQSVTWTIDDARKAGLAGRANWTRYPRQMLEARATAQLCRLVFPDVLGASRYATEELAEGEAPPEPDGAPQAATQAPVAGQKRSRGKPARTIATGAELEARGYPAVAMDSTELAGHIVDEARRRADPPPRPPLPGEPLEDPQPDPIPTGLVVMSDAQRKRLFAALREADITSRDDRLTYCSEILQRPIGSSAELTPGDASAVIEAAIQLAAQMHPSATTAPVAPVDVPLPLDTDNT